MDQRMLDESNSRQAQQPKHISPADETVPDQLVLTPQVIPVSPTEDTVPDQPVPVLHMDATLPQYAPAVWPPPREMFERHRPFPIGMIVLLVSIALLLIIGGMSLLVYSASVQYSKTLSANATAQAQLTAQVQSTQQANALSATATGQVLATAQAGIEATATTQVEATASAIAATNLATATVTALQDMYARATSGTPVLDDPLSDNSGKHKWDEGKGQVANTGCAFTDGAYQASESQLGYFQPCFAEATHFSNFAYQVQMTITSGNLAQGGILFRANSATGQYYLFRIGIDGSYALELYNNNQFTTLSSGFSSQITTGLNSQNELDVLANNNTLYLYVNQGFITSVTDSTLSSGQIGVVAIDTSTPVVAQFTNAQVWNLSASG
jgi:hypothetical protein